MELRIGFVAYMNEKIFWKKVKIKPVPTKIK
jgi:hypothetical protein